VWVFRAILRTIVGSLAAYPLVLLAITTSFLVHWDWKWWISFPALLLGGSVTAGIHGLRASVVVLNDALGYWREFRDCRFTPITEVALLENLYSSSKDGSSHDPQKIKRFIEDRRSAMNLLYKDFLTIIRVSDGSKTPPGLVTYGCPYKAFMFLTDSLEEIDDFNRFQLLHELGHTQWRGVLFSQLGEQFAPYVLATPVFFLLLAWTLQNVVIIFLLIGLLMVFLKIQTAHATAAGLFVDEATADSFALEHCEVSWLGDSSAEELADVLCQDSKLNQSSPGLADVRRRLFATAVNNIRSGQQDIQGESVYLWHLNLAANLLSATQVLQLLLTLYVAFHCAEMTAWRAFVTAGVLYVFSVLAICFHALVRYRIEQVNVRLGIGQLSENSIFLQEHMRQGFERREKLRKKAGFKE
jgi:hypothetical protein